MGWHTCLSPSCRWGGGRLLGQGLWRVRARAIHASTATGRLAPTLPALLPPAQLLDAGLEKLNVPYSYGFAIIALTVLVKAATFPLSQKQVGFWLPLLPCSSPRAYASMRAVKLTSTSF